MFSTVEQADQVRVDSVGSKVRIAPIIKAKIEKNREIGYLESCFLNISCILSNMISSFAS